jgi:hypothetical protein
MDRVILASMAEKEDRCSHAESKERAWPPTPLEINGMCGAECDHLHTSNERLFSERPMAGRQVGNVMAVTRELFCKGSIPPLSSTD